MNKIVGSILIFIILCTQIEGVCGTKNTIDDCEKHRNQIINSFAKEMNKDHQLKCVGDGGWIPEKIEEISLMFVAYQKMTLDEARKLEVTVIEKFLKKINDHKKIQPFLKEHPIRKDRAEISISFRKPDNTPYRDGSVARVTNIKGKLYYREDKGDPNKYFPLYEEPYEDALRIVNQSSARKLP